MFAVFGITPASHWNVLDRAVRTLYGGGVRVCVGIFCGFTLVKTLEILLDRDLQLSAIDRGVRGDAHVVRAGPVARNSFRNAQPQRAPVEHGLNAVSVF